MKYVILKLSLADFKWCSVALTINDTWYGRKNQNYRKIATYIRYTTQN